MKFLRKKEMGSLTNKMQYRKCIDIVEVKMFCMDGKEWREILNGCGVS